MSPTIVRRGEVVIKSIPLLTESELHPVRAAMWAEIAADFELYDVQEPAVAELHDTYGIDIYVPRTPELNVGGGKLTRQFLPGVFGRRECMALLLVFVATHGRGRKSVRQRVKDALRSFFPCTLRC
jgi:hypothetical protein